MIDKLIFLGLLLGFMGWILHYIFIITAIFSKEKWLIWVHYNKYHEGMLEFIGITGIIIVYIIILLNL